VLKDNNTDPVAKQQIKDSLKAPIVGIVNQIYKSPDFNPRNQSFLAELRNYLMVNLNKTINNQFDLTFPHFQKYQLPTTVESITKRLDLQKCQQTDGISALYLQRCEIEPLNPQWPFEYAVYLFDRKADNFLYYFTKAISIDKLKSNKTIYFCTIYEHLIK
jgi:hypothetical protein